MSMPSLLEAFPARQPAFRRRIVLLSHGMRVLAVVWALWNLVNVVRSLINLSHAPSIAGAGHHGLLAAAIMLAVPSWLLTAGVAWCVWCLFTTYLQGRCRPLDAARGCARARRFIGEHRLATIPSPGCDRAYSLHDRRPAVCARNYCGPLRSR